LGKRGPKRRLISAASKPSPPLSRAEARRLRRTRKHVADGLGIPAATARRANAASVESIRHLMQGSACALYLADDGKHVRSMVVRVGHALQQPCAPRGLVMARNGSSGVGREHQGSLRVITPPATCSLRSFHRRGQARCASCVPGALRGASVVLLCAPVTFELLLLLYHRLRWISSPCRDWHATRVRQSAPQSRHLY
jgi:hypothetical protein